MEDIKQKIEEFWNDRSLSGSEIHQAAVHETIAFLDTGTIRVASPEGDTWQVHDWVKNAVLLYFLVQKMETIEVGPF